MGRCFLQVLLTLLDFLCCYFIEMSPFHLSGSCMFLCSLVSLSGTHTHAHADIYMSYTSAKIKTDKKTKNQNILCRYYVCACYLLNNGSKIKMLRNS